MMKRLLLFIVLFTIVAPIAKAQEKEDVLIWGLYLDLANNNARDAAKLLSDAGYSLRVDSLSNPPHLLLSPGGMDKLSRFFRSKRKDGIRVHGFDVGANNRCDEKTNAKDSLIRYKYLRNNFINQFAIQQQDFVPKRIEKAGYDEVRRFQAAQNKRFRKFLKQKGNPGDLSNYSWTSLGIPLNNSWETDEISFQFIKRRSQLATLRFDTVPGARVEYLKAFEVGECKPFVRSTKFKELYGIGPKRFTPLYYVPRSKTNSVHKFELNFEKNKSSYSSQDVKEVITLMKDENKTIIRARVEGYASVEGSLENNTKLQEERARILLEILQKYNDEQILLDTVITTENWKLFREQLAGTKYEWIDTLSNAKIKELLEQDSFSAQMEPFLKKQRRAELTVTLSRKLNNEDKVDFMFRDLQSSLYFVCNPGKSPVKRDFRDRVYGILNYMELAVERGLIDKGELLNRVMGDKTVIDILFYKAYDEYVNQNKISTVFDLEDVIKSAQQLYTDMLMTYSVAGQKKLDCISLSKGIIRHLADVHNFVFRLVEDKALDQEILSYLKYPNEIPFYPIILHHLYSISFVSTLRIDPRDLENSMQNTMSVNPALYYLIKKIVIENDKDVQSYVYRSDDILEFDMWYLLAVSINNWEVNSQKYYDPSVDVTVINQQLNRLNRMSEYLCTWQLDQLKLSFYLKVLHHYINVGLKKEYDRNLMMTSFNFLKQYYIKNIDLLTEETALEVAAQFVLVDNLFMSRSGSAGAYQLLKRLSTKKQLSEKGDTYRMRLAYYHDPNFIKLVNDYDDKKWCSLFRGKYGLIPYGSLVDKVCTQCN